MILLWKSVSLLCSVAQWQGITLSVEFRDHAWRIALTNAALVPDGGVVKGAWPTKRAAQHEAEMTVERIVVGRKGHVQAHQHFDRSGLRLVHREVREPLLSIVHEEVDSHA